VSSIQYQPLTPDLNETAKEDVHRIIARRHGFDPSVEGRDRGMGHDQVGADGGPDFTAMDVFLAAWGFGYACPGSWWGIINIMLVTVTDADERDRLRKALAPPAAASSGSSFWRGCG